MAVFVLIYGLRESPSSAVGNRFELRRQLKLLLLLYYRICPSSLHHQDGIYILGSVEEKEPTVEFKNTRSKEKGHPAPAAKGITPIELSLSPTLFNINLNVKKVSTASFVVTQTQFISVAKYL